MSSRIALGLIGAALISLPAMAQTNPPAARSPNPQVQATAAYQMKEGQWRATKLKGLNVYNATNEKIGDINEMIIDRDGRIDAVVVGAGGFLGMGEHDVAVPFAQIKWVDQPVRDHAATGSSVPPANTPPRDNVREAHRWYPDHAVLNMTKDQLKALPEVRYSR